MVCVNGKVQDLKVRVFKWNQKLSSVTESQGLFMLRIKSKIKGVTKSNDGEFIRAFKFTEQNEAIIFDHKSLKDRETMQQWLWLVFTRTDLFPFHTTLNLAKDISAFLFSCFQFNTQTSTKPITVIVADVYMLRVQGCTRTRPLSSNEEVKDINDAPISNLEGKKRKIADVEGDSLDVESHDMHSKEVKEIQQTLMCFLEEPLHLWVKPIVFREPRGLNQVEAGLKVKKFDGHELVDHICPICLAGFKRGMVVATTPCSHMFHRDCLFQWLPKSNCCCPMCRSFCATAI